MTQPHSAEILGFQPKTAHEYFDPTVDLETLPIPLVRFPGFKQTTPDKEMVCRGWQELIVEVAPELTGTAPDQMIYRKENVPYFIAGTLIEAELIGKTLEQALKEGRHTFGKQRSSKHVAALGPAFFFDDDGDVFARETRLRALRVAAIIYSSHSYGLVKEGKTEPSRGGRVVVVVNRAVTPAEYVIVWDALNYLFGGGFDEHGRSPWQCYGKHVRRSVDAHPKRVIIDGAAFDADALIALGRSLHPPRSEREPKAPEFAPAYSLLEQTARVWLMCTVRPPDTYGEWFPMAAACKRAFPDDIDTAFQCSQKYGGREAARKKFNEVPAEYDGDAKEVTLEMLHWRAKRRAEKVIRALWLPPLKMAPGFEDLPVEGPAEGYPKGGEPIPPGTVKTEDGVTAIDYLLFCWNEKALEETQTKIPQPILDKAHRRTEERRTGIKLGGRVLHKWDGSNLATATTNLANAIIDASQLFFKIDRILVRVSDPSRDPKHAARLRKIHNYEGPPGGKDDPVKGGMRLTPVLSDTEAVRALIAEHIAIKVPVKKGTGRKAIYENVISSFAFKSNTSILQGPDAAVLRDLCKRALPERAPEVVGVITAPVMPRLPISTRPKDLLREDADYIITKPGFDPASGLYFAPIGMPVKVSAQPSKNEVQNAVELLQLPFLEFPFTSPEGNDEDEREELDAEERKQRDEEQRERPDPELSRSVAIYGAMIAANRRVLPTAPGIAFSSHGEGVSQGKTLVSGVIITIATGGPPVPVGFSPDFAEQEKQITSYLLEGDGSLFIDNLANAIRFDSTTLAKIMTNPRYKGRLLGVTKPIEVNTRAMVVANGNSLNMAGDIASRFLLSWLDTGLERPQDRSNSNFKIPNLTEWTIEHRQEIVAAVHTIVRAYLQECRQYRGTPPDVKKRREMEGTRVCGQCEFLRDAFLWAFPKLPDPFLGSKASSAASSTREDKAQLLALLNQAMEIEVSAGRKCFLSSEILQISERPEEKELASLLHSVLPKDHTLNSNTLGKWLWNQLANAPIDGLVLRRKEGKARAKYFWIEKLIPPTISEGDGD
jgi:hypothetical protein